MTGDPKPKGFSEREQAGYGSRRAELPKHSPVREQIKLGEGGRFVIPASMRGAMGIKPGDSLIAYVEDGELRIRSYEDNLRRIQAKYSSLKKPGESVVEQFLAERRAMWGEE